MFFFFFLQDLNEVYAVSFHFAALLIASVKGYVLQSLKSMYFLVSGVIMKFALTLLFPVTLVSFRVHTAPESHAPRAGEASFVMLMARYPRPRPPSASSLCNNAGKMVRRGHRPRVRSTINKDCPPRVLIHAR